MSEIILSFSDTSVYNENTKRSMIETPDITPIVANISKEILIFKEICSYIRDLVIQYDDHTGDILQSPHAIRQTVLKLS